MTRHILTTLAVSALALGLAPAQETVKAKVEDIVAQVVKTPDFQVSGTKKKRNTPKEWLEVEVAFQVESTGKGDFVGGLEVHFFVFPKTASDPAMRKVLTSKVEHVNLLKGETLHSAVYISPNTLAAMFGKDKTINTRDIAVAIEIHSGGLVGGDATEKKTERWWQSPAVDKIGTIGGYLRPKHKTPFAQLWYDRYAEVKES